MKMQRFDELMQGDDARIDLAEACLLIAEDAYPGLRVEHYLGEIERMAIRLRSRLPQSNGAEERIIALNQFLYDDLGFRGNAKDYYDARNSYLNEVIDRRVGIPITLSILYMEVGRRIGLPLEGVSFPGHFLVKLKLRGGALMLDPFSGGEPLAEDDLRERLRRVVNASGQRGTVLGGMSVDQLPLDQLLEPATRKQILTRVLRNLKGIYRKDDKPERLLQVLNRILTVSPEAHHELRDRGLVYRRLECFRAALKDLKDYLEAEPEASDSDEIRATAVELSLQCARLN
jgi:regulator of sirC expression with transglutaminase-like and TPR domain